MLSALAMCVMVVFLLSAAASLHPQADDDSASDVWLQLLEHCASISSCQPALIRDLSLQLVQQQELVQAQQHTIEQLQQQVNSLEQHNVEQQQQAGLQQDTLSQLQQQAAEAVELRERVALVEGRLAQVLQALQTRS